MQLSGPKCNHLMVRSKSTHKRCVPLSITFANLTSYTSSDGPPSTSTIEQNPLDGGRRQCALEALVKHVALSRKKCHMLVGTVSHFFKKNVTGTSNT